MAENVVLVLIAGIPNHSWRAFLGEKTTSPGISETPGLGTAKAEPWAQAKPSLPAKPRALGASEPLHIPLHIPRTNLGRKANPSLEMGESGPKYASGPYCVYSKPLLASVPR